MFWEVPLQLYWLYIVKKIHLPLASWKLYQYSSTDTYFDIYWKQYIQ